MLLSPRLYPALILAGCIAALVGALVAQFGFGLRPCILCLYQRVPFSLGAVLALIALLPAVPGPWRARLVWLCAAVLLINSGIAVFHVGVEQHWWEGLAACVGAVPKAMTPTELMASLRAPPEPRCDQIPWSLWGISMAGFNIPYSLGLAGFSAWAARKLG
jgi:disulfide bond formation protein DsbB